MVRRRPASASGCVPAVRLRWEQEFELWPPALSARAGRQTHRCAAPACCRRGAACAAGASCACGCGPSCRRRRRRRRLLGPGCPPLTRRPACWVRGSRRRQRAPPCAAPRRRTTRGRDAVEEASLRGGCCHVAMSSAELGNRRRRRRTPWRGTHGEHLRRAAWLRAVLLLHMAEAGLPGRSWLPGRWLAGAPLPARGRSSLGFPRAVPQVPPVLLLERAAPDAAAALADPLEQRPPAPVHACAPGQQRRKRVCGTGPPAHRPRARRAAPWAAAHLAPRS